MVLPLLSETDRDDCLHFLDGPYTVRRRSPPLLRQRRSPAGPHQSTQRFARGAPSQEVRQVENPNNPSFTPFHLLSNGFRSFQAIDGPLIAEVDMGGSDSTTTVQATVVQASTVFYDTVATLDKAERLIADAAAYGAQLVVFPEAFIGRYPHGSNFGITIGSRSAKGKEEFRKYHSAAIDVPDLGEIV